jgi:RNA polymerase subunit RPABC4/transcription elongation factor Spt4
MKSILTGLGLLTLALLSACTSPKPMMPPQTAVPITDFAQIAGKWEGVVVPDPQPANAADDWLRVVISADGTYALSSFPEVGLLESKGSLTLSNGQAIDRGEKGTVAFVLHEEKGKRTLKAAGVANDGREYTSDLGPKR